MWLLPLVQCMCISTGIVYLVYHSLVHNCGICLDACVVHIKTESSLNSASSFHLLCKDFFLSFEANWTPSGKKILSWVQVDKSPCPVRKKSCFCRTVFQRWYSLDIWITLPLEVTGFISAKMMDWLKSEKRAHNILLQDLLRFIRRTHHLHTQSWTYGYLTSG